MQQNGNSMFPLDLYPAPVLMKKPVTSAIADWIKSNETHYPTAWWFDTTLLLTLFGQLPLSFCFQIFCSLTSLYKHLHEYIPRVSLFSPRVLPFYFHLSCGASKLTSLNLSATGYRLGDIFFRQCGIWKCNCNCETACDLKVNMQVWNHPLAQSLGCIFWTGEMQTGLLKGEQTLLLWSLKIYLGKKMVQWRILTIYSESVNSCFLILLH